MAKKTGRIGTAIEGLRGSEFLSFMTAGALFITAINPFKPRWRRILSGAAAGTILYRTGRKLGREKKQLRNEDI